MTDDGQEFAGLNYELLVEDALRMVVRAALQITELSGLPGETHFYIAFKTDFEGVEIDDALRAQHPDTITIVMQHQFADLEVRDDSFSVTLFFAGKPSVMRVPFAAITSFNDPSVGFGLQFGASDEDDRDDFPPAPLGEDEISATSDSTEPGGSAEVVSLDSFRKSPS